MNSYKQLLKILSVGFLVFFMVNTTLSSGLYQDVAPGDNRIGPGDPIPSIFGRLGEDNWYIAEVTIFFSYDPQIVDEIQYFLDDNWHVVNNGHFSVSDDGFYQIPWHWIDFDGKTHNIALPLIFKLDTTGPTVQLTKKSISRTEDLFTATASDPVSDVEYVEFYLDGELQETVDTAPYQYTWKGNALQTVYAVAYNYAGLPGISNNLTTPRAFFVDHYIMLRFFVLLRTMLFRLF